MVNYTHIFPDVSRMFLKIEAAPGLKFNLLNEVITEASH